jgi:hypothetical protein
MAGFLAALLLNQNLWMQDGLVSGTPKAFIYPLFLAFLYYLLRRSLVGICIAIALLGLFYPTLVFICAGILILKLWHFDRGLPRLSSNPQVAEIINQADNSLVISITKRITRSTSLSYLLEPQTRFMLVNESAQPQIPDGFSEIFLFRPYEELIQALEKQNYKIKPVYEKGKLWRVEK